MQIPFVGGAYADKSLNLNAQDCVNWFPVLDQQGGTVPIALYPTAGLTEFSDTSNTAVARGLYPMLSYLYAVVGNKFFRVTSAGVATEVDTLDTSTGIVQMSDNGSEILVTDGSYGYIYDYSGNTLTKIVDAGFPTPTSNTFQDGYFIVTKDGTGEIYISSLYDGTSWAALDYTTAEGRPDYALAVKQSHRELWVFGQETVESYYNSGDSSFPFERIPGVFLESGLGAVNSLVKLDNSFIWLDNKYQIVRSEAYSPKIISTRQIDYQISTYTTKSDAIAFGYTQEGHTFYQISFPAAGYTWVYDCATNYWHRRASYPDNGRHRANCYVSFSGKHLVGDHTNGIIYELDPDTYTDDGNAIHRIRTTQAIHKDRKMVFFKELELEFEAGVGLATGATDPQAMLKWSDDGGHTWSNEIWQPIGMRGEYDNLSIWNQLGCSRNRVWDVRITDAVKPVLLSAHLEAEVGYN